MIAQPRKKRTQVHFRLDLRAPHLRFGARAPQWAPMLRLLSAGLALDIGHPSHSHFLPRGLGSQPSVPEKERTQLIQLHGASFDPETEANGSCRRHKTTFSRGIRARLSPAQPPPLARSQLSCKCSWCSSTSHASCRGRAAGKQRRPAGVPNCAINICWGCTVHMGARRDAATLTANDGAARGSCFSFSGQVRRRWARRVWH